MSEVYLFGMISPSTVYVIDNQFTFPRPNQYAEIRQHFSSIGGEAVNSAIMLSKLGIATKLDGTWLNQQCAERVFNILAPFGIDVSRLTVKEDCGTEEIVITDRDSRTVFGNYARFHSSARQWNEPHEADIQRASFVSLDPYLRDESLHVAELCVHNRKPYVTIDCRYDDFLAQNADVIIISHELRDQAYPDHDFRDLFQHYQANCKGLVIFTFGSNTLWYARPKEGLKLFQPYRIAPVDTTGAGDTFRAGIIYGILNSWTDDDTIKFASAVAACVCLTIPHALNAPGKEAIFKFMEEYR